MYKTFILKGLLSLFLIMAATNVTKAQSGDGDLNSAWSLNVNTGPSLLWGDMSDKSDPFSKMFSPESKFSFGIIGRKGLGNVFGVNLQAIVGNVKGNRDEWSNGTPTGGFTSETFFTELNANLDVDLLNIFSAADRRLVNPYLKAGVGMTYFKANVTYQGIDYNGSEKSALDIPMGGGIRFDVSRRIGITLETTLHYTMTDWFDGFSTVNSEANDWYSYTSVGMTYRFVPKQSQKEPSYEEETDIEEVVAETEVEPVKPKVPFKVEANMPSEIFQGDTFLVKIHVTVGDAKISGNMKLQQTLPKGFAVEAGSSSGARFDFTNQTINYFWSTAPTSNQFDVSYTVYAVNSEVGEVTIPGIALYTEDSVDKIANFPKNMNIKAFATKDMMLVVTEESPLRYRIQVQAIYGGKTTAQEIQRRYNIDKEVHVDYEGGYTKYTVGEYMTYEEARIYRDQLRNNGLPGAFVVGYYDDSRIKDIKQAVEIEKSGKTVMVVGPATTQNVNDVYRIQIAASSLNRSTYQIKSKYGVQEEVSKKYIGGLYKYTIGKFKSYEEAKKKLEQVKKNIPDAFIVVE